MPVKKFSEKPFDLENRSKSNAKSGRAQTQESQLFRKTSKEKNLEFSQRLPVKKK